VLSREPRSGEGQQVSPFYIPAADTDATRSRRVLKYADCFAVLDESGGAHAEGGATEGLFFEDTRHLSRLLVTLDQARPLLLSSTVTDDDLMLSVDLVNPDLMHEGRLRLARATVHILSSTFLGEDSLFQSLELRNYGMSSTHLWLAIHFAADFADIFEVRGSVRRQRGMLLAEERSREQRLLAYRGLDGVIRKTRLSFNPPEEAERPLSAGWYVSLPPGGSRLIRLAIRCEHAGRASGAVSADTCLAAQRARVATRKLRNVGLETDDEAFNTWLDRSRADLEMLATETAHGLYPYAGIPWFSTAFGRDGLITSLECLWLEPELAAGVLRFLATQQATTVDRHSDAEPGKILHETRKGEMAKLGEVPFGRYYGSIDSTPLFLMLLDAYHARTGDLDLVRGLWPNAEAAFGWMKQYGDADGDGFLEYKSKSADGLANQGWKDSNDAIFHADGSLAEGPIALAEVQAYAYAAYLGGARLANVLDLPQRVKEFTLSAERLKDRFEATFWREELGTYALALDGNKEPCAVRSSNAGHVLLAGLASATRAGRVAESLMGGESFSGWGIRTVAAAEKRYNPVAYHNGSVWPHDNALIAMGFSRYGLKAPVLRLLDGLCGVAQFMPLSRLPELFCGFPRRTGTGPTSYPVACSPQAWSSAAVFAMLGAALGISYAPRERQIRFSAPALPLGVDELRLTNLRLAGASVDLLLRRNAEEVELTVLRREGQVEIVLTG
jgi:glycogen debranching enzyme